MKNFNNFYCWQIWDHGRTTNLTKRPRADHCYLNESFHYNFHVFIKFKLYIFRNNQNYLQFDLDILTICSILTFLHKKKFDDNILLWYPTSIYWQIRYSDTKLVSRWMSIYRGQTVLRFLNKIDMYHYFCKNFGQKLNHSNCNFRSWQILKLLFTQTFFKYNKNHQKNSFRFKSWNRNLKRHEPYDYYVS